MTTYRHLLSSYRATLAPVAAHERDGRARHYPGQIERREIDAEEAHADWAAWSAIQTWLSSGAKPAWIEWEAMVEVAAKALERRRAASNAAPADQGLAARRDAVAAIHGILADHRAWLIAMTEQLRADARLRRAAA